MDGWMVVGVTVVGHGPKLRGEGAEEGDHPALLAYCG